MSSGEAVGDEGSPVAWALTVNVIVAAGKVAVGLLSGSAAVMAEAAHSAVDCSTQLLLLVGERHGAARPGAQYRYGVAAALVMLVSGGVYGVVAGLRAMVGDAEVGGSLWLAVAVLVGASSLEATSLWRAVRCLARTRGGRGWLVHLRTTPDTASKTVVVEDGADILGNVVALAGVALTAVTGLPLWDGLASVLVGALLTLLSVELATHNVRCIRTA